MASMIAAAVPTWTVTPASAITAELAKKCRQMAFEAHPPVRAGTKAGTGAEARVFYQSCVANNGKPPNDGAKTGAGSPQTQTGTTSPPPAKPQ